MWPCAKSNHDARGLALGGLCGLDAPPGRMHRGSEVREAAGANSLSLQGTCCRGSHSQTEQWKSAQPSDGAARGKWWEVFHDSQLNALEQKADTSNQEIAAAAANFFAARAVIREARSQYFPTVATNPSIMNARPSAGQFGGVHSGSSSASGFTLTSFTDYSAPADASWEPDLWGRVRNTVRGATYAAQASSADLENVRLSVEAELAADYYQLRAQDALKQLFDTTVIAYRESLNLTQVQFKAGIGTDEAVAQAEAQLEATQAQDTNLGVLRAQYEHAIALLVGEPASTFSIPVEPLNANPPAIPPASPPIFSNAARTSPPPNARWRKRIRRLA